MNDELEDPSAFELFCVDLDFAANDKQAAIPTPSISPEVLAKPQRAEFSMGNLELHFSQGPVPLSRPPGPTRAKRSKQDHVVSIRQCASPASSPESNRPQSNMTSPSKDKQQDIHDNHEETDSEEHDRLVKHRAVNRKTAAKARQRDKVQTAFLEKSFEEATARNPILKRTIVSLHEELYNLQMEALGHVGCTCSEIQAYNRKRARKISQCWALDEC